MSRFCLLALMAILLGGCFGNNLTKVESESKDLLWQIDNLTEIGGHPVSVLGSPKIIEMSDGRAVEFDGQDDALILDSNPLAGASMFTVEVIFRPDQGGEAEQRFLHFQAAEDHRVLVETRLNDQGEWFLDTFIKAGESERTLQSRQNLHPLGHWYHSALVYDGQEMRHYVNGAEERSDSVNFLPMEGGQTSIGCRLNRVYWFKGAIRTIRVSHRALSPGEFISIRD